MRRGVATIFIHLSLFLILGLLPVNSKAESVIRIGMTAGDIPDWTAEPDQGWEGLRFVTLNLYDGLINWDLSRSDVDAPLTPGLATKWNVDPNNHKRWIFELRRGVTFHDGCEWNADVALWNFDRVVNEEAPQFNPVHAARSRTRNVNFERAEKIDSHKIAIYTKTVESPFPYNLTIWPMISKCALEKARNDYKVYAQSPAGTGPYKFGRVVPHERLELIKNPNYWNPQRIPKNDRLVLIPMPEATTRVAAILSKQIDIAEAPPPDSIAHLKSAGINVVTGPYPHNWTYIIKAVEGPFHDVRVRRAANHAINRQEIVDMLGGVVMPSYSAYGPHQKYYGNPPKMEFDLAKAKSLLKEANCLPCRITVGISTSGSGQIQPLPMNEVIKNNLEAVGFEVTFEVMDWNTLFDVFLKGWEKNPRFDALNVSAPTVDPLVGLIRQFGSDYKSPRGPNWGWFSHEEFDSVARQALLEFDEAKQTKLFSRLNEIASEQAARIFVVHDLNPRAISPRLKGFVQAQSWFQDLTPVTVQD